MVELIKQRRVDFELAHPVSWRQLQTYARIESRFPESHQKEHYADDPEQAKYSGNFSSLLSCVVGVLTSRFPLYNKISFMLCNAGGQLGISVNYSLLLQG